MPGPSRQPAPRTGAKSRHKASAGPSHQPLPGHADYLIIGGGVAAASAAETLRAEGDGGSIVILSAESVRPYNRPPLSKTPLMTEAEQQKLFVHDRDFYRQQDIRLCLDTPVARLLPDDRQVLTTDGATIGYDKLLIATGATPRQLDIPGSQLKGVHSLRTLDDARHLHDALKQARRAVVLGGSFLGMEITMSLIAAGLDVTVIEHGPTLLYRLAAPPISAMFADFATSRGASLLLNDHAVKLHGQGSVTAVETRNGRRIDCDLVIVSIGVRPVTDFLADSGIALHNGYVAVDEQLRSNHADVFAAGDVTEFHDPVFARRRHIEHWDNAVKQGRLAARNMLGQRRRFDEVSVFFCEIGEFGFNVVGDTDIADEWITRGDAGRQSFAQFYLKDNIPRAVFSFGRPVDETRDAEAMIRYRINVGEAKDQLADEGFSLDQLPLQTALILQGGGALGAYECGVVRAMEQAAIYPDIVAGVSIGAFNGAIIASHPRDATGALEAFWRELSVTVPKLPFTWAMQSTAAMQILSLGVPGFFRPRWLSHPGQLLSDPTGWTSYYDTSPMRELIARYVDFPGLKTSPVRLLVSAVNVTTARLEIFDSYVDDLTPAHILASGSLPPGFPWTTIDGQAYWDGGIISNSPLDLVAERCGPDGKRLFIIDLFASHRNLPANMMEVMARRDEILYAERIRNDLRYRETIESYRALVERALGHMPDEAAARLRRHPQFIQLMGRRIPSTITRLVRKPMENEPPSRDYDFSDAAVEANMREGYETARRLLAGESD